MFIRFKSLPVFRFHLIAWASLASQQASVEPSPFIRAEALFQEGLYEDALFLYKEMERGPHPLAVDYLDFLKIRQTECCLELEDGASACDHLTGSTFSSDDKKIKAYLLAVAFRRLQKHQEAIEALNAYQSTDLSSLFDQAIRLEQGLNYFYLNEFEKSFHSLSLVNERSDPRLSLMAKLYLIRLALIEQKFKDCRLLIDQIAPSIPASHLLHAEFAYLQGLLFFKNGDYQQASQFFEQALPTKNKEACPWHQDNLAYLIDSYLKSAQDPLIEKNKQAEVFQQAHQALETMRQLVDDESFYVALANFYLTKAQCLQDQDAYAKAQQLLKEPKCSASFNQPVQFELLKAAIAPSCLERDRCYQKVMQKLNEADPLYFYAWHLRGINQFEEALKLKKERLMEPSRELFRQAGLAFNQALPLERSPSPQLFAKLNYLILSYFYQDTAQTTRQAWNILQEWIVKTEERLLSIKEFQHLYELAGLIALELFSIDPDSISAREAETILQNRVNFLPNHPKADEFIYQLAYFYFQQNNDNEADKLFASLIQKYPASPYKNNALFWMAKDADKRGDSPQMRTLFHRVFTESPQDPLAPSSYFYSYAYRDYLTGNRQAIKHLRRMPLLFPKDPLTLSALYLIGLDYKKDRLSDEGDIQRPQHLNAAIEAFQEAESLFETLYRQKNINDAQLSYFIRLYYQCALERGLANLAIADQSQASKRLIYLSYAEAVFQRLKDHLHEAESSVARLGWPEDPYPKAFEEAEFWLGQIYLKQNQLDQAEKLFSHMIDHYATARLSKRPLLSRAWSEKGKIEQERQKPELALADFQQAEQTAIGLSLEQKLDLWIQQSLCHKELARYDEAIQLLSKVINEERPSILRSKAMLLRAEIYEAQGRSELALKQLDATSKKEDEWGQKAKEKLEKNYGYH